MRERLDGKDLRFLAACLAVLVAAVWFSAKFFYRAFPEASIDFVVTREQARALAEQFLASQGFRPAGYREASLFTFDNTAKTFLEREMKPEQANQVLGRRLRLWRWSHRWFRPQQKEEYRVEITTRGELAGFAHLIPEAAQLPSLPTEQARALAEGFLRQKLGRDPATLDFVESSAQARPARTDYTFTWKERDFNFQDSSYRLEVGVLGNQVGGYREYLKVPEAWLRDYQRLRSRNETASLLDVGLFLLLGVGLIATFLSAVRGHDVKWWRAVMFGAVGTVLSFFAAWNALPLAEFGYPTTDSYASFLARRLLSILGGALASGGFIALLTAGAEPLYRRSFGTHPSLGNLFRWRGIRTKSFFRGVALGLTLTGLFVAYQTAFYLLASRLGAWSPADVPYDDMLNTRFPWLFVLLGGFFPAVFEEFTFRMFAIPFLGRLTRSVGVGVVLAGFIWGFGHAAYPQQPFYIRGVEVGIGGVVLGLVMLRWGILPTLVWHYSTDALYTALLLLRSHNLYFVLSGGATAGIMLLPLLAAGIAYLRGGGFEPETGLSNAEEGAAVREAEPEPVPVAELPYQQWSGRRRVIVALAAAVLAVLGLTVRQPSGSLVRFAVAGPRAHAAADAFLRTLGIDPASYRSVTYTEAELSRDAAKYFLERRPVSYLKQVCRLVPLYSWDVRYFKPLQKEEVRVRLDPQSGRIIGFEHGLPEDQPGADLPAAQAEQVADSFLRAFHLDLETLERKETVSEKKKARRDYALAWEAKPGDPRNLGEAHYRVQVTVAGDRVVGLRELWKLPENFLRERSRRNALAVALLGLQSVLGALVVVAVLWVLIQRTRRRQLRWRPAIAIALLIAGLSLLQRVLDFSLSLRSYSTAISLAAFRAQQVAGLAIGAIGLFLLAACAAGWLLAVRPEAPAAFRAGNRRRLGLDALLATAVAAGLAFFLQRFHALAVERFHAFAQLGGGADLFDSAVPVVSAIASAATQTLLVLALLAGLAHLARWVRRRWLFALAVLVAIAALAGGVHTRGEFLFECSVLLLSAAAALAWCVWCARDNYLAYALAIWTLALGRTAAEFLSQPAASLRGQGALMVLVLAVTLLCALAPALRRAKPLEGGTVPTIRPA